MISKKMFIFQITFDERAQTEPVLRDGIVCQSRHVHGHIDEWRPPDDLLIVIVVATAGKF